MAKERRRRISVDMTGKVQLFAFDWLKSPDGLLDACVDSLRQATVMECASESIPLSVPILPSVTEVVQSGPFKRSRSRQQGRHRGYSSQVALTDIETSCKLASPRTDATLLTTVDENGNDETPVEKQPELTTEQKTKLVDLLISHAEKHAAFLEEKITETFARIATKLDERKMELITTVRQGLEDKVSSLRKEKRNVAVPLIDPGKVRNGLKPSPGNAVVGIDRNQDAVPVDCNGIQNSDRFARLCSLDNVIYPPACHLAHGTTSFKVDDVIFRAIANLGTLQDDLSSAMHAVVSGVGVNYGLVGEASTFDVHTRTKNGQACGANEDLIEVIVVEERGNEICDSTVSRSSVGTYKAAFTPSRHGLHHVHVFVNGLAVAGSPFACDVYDVSDLRFDSSCGQGKPRTLSDGHFNRRTSCDGNWVLQKDCTAAVMSNTSCDYCKIFCSNQMRDGVFAWKVSVTTACTAVRLGIGVATKSFIKDLEEEYLCSFSLGDAPRKQGTPHRQRKVSTFERHSHSYITIINTKERWLKVISCGTNTEQTMILKDNNISYFPTFIVEHLCQKIVCPRPMLSFS